MMRAYDDMMTPVFPVCGLHAVRPERHAAFEAGADREPEDPIEAELDDERVHRGLAMLPHDIRKKEARRGAIIEAAEIGLDLQQLARAVERHVLSRDLCEAIAANILSRMCVTEPWP